MVVQTSPEFQTYVRVRMENHGIYNDLMAFYSDSLGY